MCCRFLATGDSFRTIATSFRVGASTVASIVSDVVTAIWDCLVEEFMAVPTAEEWRVVAERFEERWNFPLCCGAIDGKHVVLKAPAVRSSSTTRERFQSFSWQLSTQTTASGSSMWGATGEPVMEEFWPTLHLVRPSTLAISSSLLTEHCRGLSTEDPCLMCL